LAERFLISRLSSLGDVVCSLPAAGALKKAFKECHVTWVVDPRFSGIAKCCEFIDDVIEARPSLNPKTWPKVPGKFTAALDLQGLLKSALVLKGVQCKTKVGYHWQREGAWLFSERVLPDPTSIHIVDQYVDVARSVGGSGDVAEFGLRPNPASLDSVREKIGDLRPFVVLNGGAGWASKRWPADSFGKLIDRLAEMGLESLLIGGPSEADRAVGREIESSAKSKPHNLIGQTNIEELVALLSLARAHVGGDTGSTHMAAAVGIPAIGLYSITKPIRSCPYGQIERCLYNPMSLRSIDVDSVAETLEEAVNDH